MVSWPIYHCDHGCALWIDDSVILKTRIGFVAKSDVPGRDPSSIIIPRLDKFLGPARTVEHPLCPVRTLLWYKSRTKVIRGNQEHMFVCYAPGKHKSASSPTTIARWICDAVKAAHWSLADASPDRRRLLGLHAHEVRALAHSLAFHSGVTLEHVLLAGSWRSPDVFINYYLTDLQVQEDDLFRIGPLVTGQTVFTRPRLTPRR